MPIWGLWVPHRQAQDTHWVCSDSQPPRERPGLVLGSQTCRKPSATDDTRVALAGSSVPPGGQGSLRSSPGCLPSAGRGGRGKLPSTLGLTEQHPILFTTSCQGPEKTARKAISLALLVRKQH